MYTLEGVVCTLNRAENRAQKKQNREAGVQANGGRGEGELELESYRA